MKSFNQYITELFQKVSPYNLFSSGNGSYTWAFKVLVSGNAKLFTTKADETTDEFIKKNGVEGRRPVRGYHYEVTFEDIDYMNSREYAFFKFDFSTEFDVEPKDIYELSFKMKEMEIVPKTEVKWSRPLFGHKTDFVFEYKSGTDDDVNLFDASAVSTIMATIMQISRDFDKQSKPKAVVFGTKETANPARAKIYTMLAKRMAKELGGKFINTMEIRKGMANPMMVVFPKRMGGR